MKLKFTVNFVMIVFSTRKPLLDMNAIDAIINKVDISW